VAKLATTDQRIITGVTYPASSYSRVIGALAVVKTPAVRDFGYTVPLGGNLWLKTVRVWFLPVWDAGTDWIDFWIRYGTGRPNTYAAMSNWEDLLPINFLGSTGAGYRELATGRVFEWTMNRLFTREAIRFGIQLTTAGLITYEEMYATFEISEG